MWGSSETCGDYRWVQCKFAGRYEFYIILGAAGLLILIIIICICRCCCCEKKKKRKSTQLDELSPQIGQNETDALMGSRHPKTDARREELKKKYNIN